MGKGKRLFFLIFDFASATSSFFREDRCGEASGRPLPAPGHAWLIYYLFPSSRALFIQPCRIVAIFPPAIFFFPLPKKTRLPLAPVASVCYLYLKPTLFKAACHPRCWDFGERTFSLHCVSSVGCVAGKRRTFRVSAPHTPGFHALHGRRGGMVVLSQPRPGPRSLFAGPTAPRGLGFTRSLAGPPGCSLSRRRPLGWLSPPLKQLGLASATGSRVLSFTRPGGRADRRAAAQPPRLGLCRATPNPGRQRGGGGFSKDKGWGEDASREGAGEVDPG